MSFEEKYEEMGLSNSFNNCYYYNDKYGEVVYRKLQTQNEGIPGTVEIPVPVMALFTKGIQPNDEFQYCGVVSEEYKFIGYDVINNQIRESINEIGIPILKENCFLNTNLTQMYNEIVVQHPTNIPTQGDIYPQIIVKNSYNGTGAANISFGICMKDSQGKDIGFGFREKISTMNQIHISNAQTTLNTAVGEYINTFSENIVELIQSSFNHQLTIDELLTTMDLIEKVGKKRKDKISSFLEELTENNTEEVPAFNLFLAITRFSSIERNLNTKVILESIAERCLTIPTQMMNIVESLKT